MKKLKTGLGLGVIAAAFLLAIGTSQNANAFRYYRWTPSGIEVQLSECNTEVNDNCAAIYNNDNSPTGGILKGDYLLD